MERSSQKVTSRARYFHDSLSEVHMRLCSLEELFAKHSNCNDLEAYYECIDALLHRIRTVLISDLLRPRQR